MPPKAPSGSQKRKKRKLDEEMRKSQAGALDKFIHRQPVEEHVETNIEDVEQEDHVEANINEEKAEEQANEEEYVEPNVNEEHVEHNPIDIFDPGRWEGLNSDQIKLLVEKGPNRDTSIVYGPYDALGRRFSTALYTRTLSNM
uniref:uncharacterized protein LOC122587697 n=1 Tax=Erigeron canadensis TaxID=72917 RepID=UPI001CB8A4B3|nr:uncharacterized protein LOC122587697 [Erigeron canadensis]